VIALYGSGMHDFVLRECEVGTRVAQAEEAEYVDPLGPIYDLLYQRDVREGKI
jgi:hypothetical protein